MKWKARAAQIEAMRLRNKGTRHRVALPDLSCESGAAPLSNTIPGGNFAPKSAPKGAKQYAVGQSHKQGPMMVTPGMVQNGELQFMGGKKT